MTPHEDAVGEPISNQSIVRCLDSDTLDALMGICHTDPAEPENCICCAAYVEVILREERKANV